MRMRAISVAVLAVTAALSGHGVAQEPATATGTPPSGGLADREGTGTSIGTPPAMQSPVAPGAAPVRRTERTDRPAERAQPYQAGSFSIYPEFGIAWMYDSNVFATRDARVSDWAMIYSPAVWVQSNWEEHAVNLYGAADLTYYNDETSENTQDWRFSGEGRYDFSADANVYGGLWWSRDHEDRESPDDRNGINPTKYYTFAGYGGYFRQFDQVSLRLGGRAEHLTFQNVATTSPAFPVLLNDDRDRWRYTGGARFGYEFSPRFEGYLQFAVDYRRYDRTPDDLIPPTPPGGGGFVRDSDGERAFVGARFNVPAVLKADVYVGYMTQDYEDARLERVSDPGFGANILWNATDKTFVSVYLDRTIEETTVFSLLPTFRVASSYLNTFGGVTVGHRLMDKWRVYGNLFASRADYQGIDRRDDYAGGGVGTAYQVNKNFIWDLSYTYRQLDSTSPLEDYDRSQVFLRLTFPISN